MKTKADTAKEYFLQGYNCAQAVLLAFAPDLGIDAKTATRLAAPLGGGVAGQRQICGALNAAAIALGLKYGGTDPSDTAAKAALYSKVKAVADMMEREHGSTICKDLLGPQAKTPAPQQRTPIYYQKRPCASIVCNAAAMVEKYLKEDK